jgi:transposase
MEQIGFGNIQKSSKLELFSKEELIQRYSVMEFELAEVIKENYELRGQKITDDQLGFILQEQLESLKNTLYGASSERYKKPEKKDSEKDKSKEPAKPKVKKPSERYPNTPIREQLIAMDPLPACMSCGKEMTDSGMTEDSEQLTVIPKKYEIILQKRVKYRCSCQSCITTAPAPARIIEGSSYSDEMIQDVVLSKYCDLIPMQRYAAMAARSGLVDLPPQSLIELSHGYADFVAPVYRLIREGALASRVLNADETPHRMLEGSDKKSWYLWGFSTSELCFLECHDTRSGDVASDILLNSNCEILVSDVYSGYGKAVRLANRARQAQGKRLIKNANCNSHARRYFFQSWKKGYKEAEFYLDHYHEIYQLNAEAKGSGPSISWASQGQSPPIVLLIRDQMKVRFEEMRKRAEAERARYPDKSNYGKALRYFLENYAGLTLFLGDPEIPIDNNSQERLLRNHVVGRKTWYGTHSKRGALTAAILFTLVETCKLNGVNPREYFKQLTQDLLAGKAPYTPIEFKRTLAATAA